MAVATIAPRPLTLLLPSRANLAGDVSTAPILARVLARSDRDNASDGDEAQLVRQFDILPRGLPIAALTRQYDCADAMSHTWLRADPAHVRPDLGSGRLLACGDLGLTREEAEELLVPLKPLFGDDGCPISLGHETRWYLSLPHGARLPAFPPPSRVLGDDIYAHLPEGDLGRRWRRLMSEAQVILHNHPLNEARVRAGKPAVNTLWFWGGGVLPDHVRSAEQGIFSDDLLLLALAQRAGVPGFERPATFARIENPARALIDLRRVRDVAVLNREWIAPLLSAQGDQRFDLLTLDFADGARCHYARSHRWRFWRRTPPAFA